MLARASAEPDRTAGIRCARMQQQLESQERALTVLSGHVKQQAAEIERLRAELGNRAGPDHPEQEDAKQDAIDDERHKAHAFDESHKKRNRRERRKKS